MKCYNHHDRDAFGVCKACGKGLCLECLTELNNTIVCNNSTCKNKINNNKLWKIVVLFMVLIATFLLIVD